MMAILEWSEGLELGIKSIDIQHKRLVGYINQLHDAMEQNEGNEAVGMILDRMVDYTASHFGYEEKLFQLHNYPGDDDHVALHMDLVNQVVDFQIKFKNNEAQLSEELMAFLKKWLTEHILIEDKKYVPFLVERGVK